MRLETKGPTGRKLQITAPTGGLDNGAIVVVRSGTSGLCATVVEGATAGGIAVAEYGHEVKVPKETGTGESFAQGALVYRDASSGKATPSSTGNTLMGFATVAAGTSVDEVWVKFNSQ